MKPLKFCANCGPPKPVDPPSLVICKDCTAKITKKLEEWAAKEEAKNA